jgi:hypothetical protein
MVTPILRPHHRCTCAKHQLRPASPPLEDQYVKQAPPSYDRPIDYINSPPDPNSDAIRQNRAIPGGDLRLITASTLMKCVKLITPPFKRLSRSASGVLFSLGQSARLRRHSRGNTRGWVRFPGSTINARCVLEHPRRPPSRCSPRTDAAGCRGRRGTPTWATPGSRRRDRPGVARRSARTRRR